MVTNARRVSGLKPTKKKKKEEEEELSQLCCSLAYLPRPESRIQPKQKQQICHFLNYNSYPLAYKPQSHKTCPILPQTQDGKKILCKIDKMAASMLLAYRPRPF